MRRKQLILQLNRKMRTLVDRGRFSGSVLIASGKDMLLRKGYGFANHQHNIPTTPETRFRIGSVTKQFTAMVVLMLQAQKQLTIDDYICNYLDNCPDHWGSITLNHLLNHTSGIPNVTDLAELQITPEVPRTPHDLIGMVLDKPLEFVAGSQWKYCNTGYYLLGLVIEKVTGQSFAAVLQSLILNPLNLLNTGCERTSVVIPQLAAGYVDGQYQPARQVDVASYYAAGALYSTIDDLYQWHLGFDQLLPEYMWKTLLETAPHPNRPGIDQYGYGWMLSTLEGYAAMYHAGRAPGCRCCISRFPTAQVFVAVLGNLETITPSLLNRELATMTLKAL